MAKHNVLRSFAKNNKGSAILTVVIAMIFVVALGTALLYAAYLGLRVSAVSRNDKENFYDASAAMDQVKQGIQEEVSEALQAAYTDTLVAYGKGNMQDITGAATSDPQKAFAANFFDELGGDLFTVKYNLLSETDDITITVDVDELREFLDPDSGETVTLTAENVSTGGEIDAVLSDDTVTIKGLELTCISSDGYESDLATDIVIEVPEFYTGSAISSQLGQYAIVANGGVFTNTDRGSVTGGIYVGEDEDGKGIWVSTNGKLTISDGKIISVGSIFADSKAKITLSSADYDIWAQEIVAGKNSTVTIDGNCYVADDLVLYGGSSVTLKGQYYGFGSDDAGTTSADSSDSSSIFVNGYEGTKATLNISGLDQLTLAGVSFINGSYATGQSVAAKTDQLAYLLPASALINYKTNPTTLDLSTVGEPTVNTAAVLWTIDGVNKTIAYYIGDSNTADTNYSGTYGSIVTYHVQSTQGTDVIGYIFIKFTNQAKANEYFKDYFTAKPDAIEQYLDIYLGLSKYDPEQVTITKGNTYRNTGTISESEWENILGSTAFPDSQADYYSGLYSKLSNSPFDTFVNTDNLDALDSNTVLTFLSGTDTVALVINKSNFTFASSPSYPNVSIIISTGDVVINSDFDGIVIADGEVTINGAITYTAPSADVLSSETSDGTPLSDYLNSDVFNGEQSTTENEWSPDKIVYYSNWEKN